jgi:hypothetical protein
VSSTVTVAYDCGWGLSRATVLDGSQTLLRHHALADQLLAEADALHDQTCPRCTSAEEDR